MHPHETKLIRLCVRRRSTCRSRARRDRWKYPRSIFWEEVIVARASTRFSFCLTISLSCLAASVSLVAHHAFSAEFDASKAVRISGTLTRIEWTNPHSYFHIDAKGETGEIEAWTCESGAPAALSRRGFRKGDIKIGDTLIVDGYRAKDGSRLIDARRVTLPDGRIVSGASAGDGGPQ
jgi:Family of unknown function (DUF6152)